MPTKSIPVFEHLTFAEAWQAATDTRESFAAFQIPKYKMDYIKNANRWFVTQDGRLFYSYMTDDKLRIVKEAEVTGCLSNAPFQYVQIMVLPGREGNLRFSGDYYERTGAIEISSKAECFAFNRG